MLQTERPSISGSIKSSTMTSGTSHLALLRASTPLEALNGQRLSRGFGGRWIWTTSKARGMVRFRHLLNDTKWEKGENNTVKAGKLIEVAPVF
jgi:hypothetical protein